MYFRTHVEEAISNLFVTKLRTFLAVLGILVGTASVVAMVSGGQLATRQALLQFKSLGTNLLSVQINQSYSKGGGSAPDRKISVSEAINSKSVSKNIEDLAPYTNVYLPMSFDGHQLNGSVIGVTNDIANIMKINIQKGRFISFLDDYEYYCVIGQQLYQNIKKYTIKPVIGQQIQVGDNFFTIVGVAKTWPQNSFVYADLNSSIMVPVKTSLLLNKYAEISSIVFKLKDKSDIDDLKMKITNYFNQHTPGKQLYFQSAKELIQKMKNQQEILTIFLGFIGSIALLVGGIGVMNIMLVSVTERKREIGIRLAIGAKRKDIQFMFLIESTVLSLFGGFVGVLIGVLISFIIADVKGWQFHLFLLPPVIGFCVSVFVGIFFGFYPAYKASKLDPIETLRSE